ncbi:MAG: type IV pilin [Haloarculaceae archaeon]
MVPPETDRGVSPVIGVVLIVAIVVILAATVSVYALGFGDRTRSPTPNIAITTEYNDSTAGDGHQLSLNVKSGDAVDTRNVTLTISGAESVDRGTESRTAVRVDGDQLADQAGSTLTAGTSIEITASTVTKESGSWGADEYLDLSGATVRIVWNPPPEDIEQSHIIFEWSA